MPDILVRFEINLNFLDRYSKNAQISKFVKIRPVGAELFQAHGRTDRHDEANSRFTANATKNHSYSKIYQVKYADISLSL